MVTPAVIGNASREATAQTGNIFREATRGIDRLVFATSGLIHQF
jgi:hypothetical protein